MNISNKNSLNLPNYAIVIIRIILTICSFYFCIIPGLMRLILITKFESVIKTIIGIIILFIIGYVLLWLAYGKLKLNKNPNKI